MEKMKIFTQFHLEYLHWFGSRVCILFHRRLIQLSTSIKYFCGKERLRCDSGFYLQTS